MKWKCKNPITHTTFVFSLPTPLLVSPADIFFKLASRRIQFLSFPTSKKAGGLVNWKLYVFI